MREWNLGSADPLVLTLAADFRLCTPDYPNDHIWELELGGGDPPALALRTTYGLRARLMRMFPRFHIDGQIISDPICFSSPPIMHRFAPNFFLFTFSPYPEISVTAEYWVPDSHAISGRFKINNTGAHPKTLFLEFCGQLIPMDGQPLSVIPMHSVNVLAGSSMDLAPVIFLTGGSLPGPGPYPSLSVDIVLASGEARTLTWVEAALPSVEESFELARKMAARTWDAERHRLEMINTAQTIDIHTGDPNWDVAFALSQKMGFSLFFCGSSLLPHSSFVFSRQPDRGFSSRLDGSDYSHLWNGRNVFETAYLTNNLPAAPELLPGLIRNFLVSQSEDGAIDWKPGLAGQRSRWLAAPLLARLARQYADSCGDLNFLREVFPKLNHSLRRWLDHDRDGDGFPEWDHLMQAGLEDHPLFSPWQATSQGGDISTSESPALASMLYSDFTALSKIAWAIERPGSADELQAIATNFRKLVEDCWDPLVHLYHLRDRDSHQTPTGRHLASQSGPGNLSTDINFNFPTRIIVEMRVKGVSLPRPAVTIQGALNDKKKTERFDRSDFQWSSSRGIATAKGLFTNVSSIQVEGIEKQDSLDVRVMDLSADDISLFLPIWAEIPSEIRAKTMITQSLIVERFWRPYGIPCTPTNTNFSDSEFAAVHLPWNTMIGEGLLAYGFRQEAAILVARLMSAVIENLKKHHCFYRSYHAETGRGMGERNALQGFAPLGLFLKTLGVEFCSPQQVILSGKNPFPWPVTVKYRGLTVTRQMEKTEIVFPNGQTAILDDPTEALVSEE